MANEKNSKNTMNKKEEALIGAGLAALAAGAYFFLGPKGKKHQKQMKGWMVKMKGDVLERLEEAKVVSEPIYNDIVDAVAKANEVKGKIPEAEIRALALDLKKQWRSLSRTLRGKKRTTRSKVSVKPTSPRRKSTNQKASAKVNSNSK